MMQFQLEQKIKIESSSGLSEDEIKKMVNDAEAHSKEDKEKKEKIEARNQLDTLIYSVEKSLKDYGDKISAEDKTHVEAAVKTAKEKVTSENTEELKKASEELAKASHKLAEHMYKDAQAQQGAAGGAQAAQGGGTATAQEKKAEDVVDAEYTAKDDDDKDKDKQK